MNNTFLRELENNTLISTENGALAYKTTGSEVLDMFALGGAYRSRSDAECIELFQKAFLTAPTLALKCLFYLRDRIEGQGERRFFRVCLKWLAENYPTAASFILPNIPEYGRWDDLYAFVGTPCEQKMFAFMYEQFVNDLHCQTPSLLGKWLKSENASSRETCQLGTKTRHAFKMSSKEYRKALASLRTKIRIVEKLMSENRWEEIEFDKLPSKAGFIYRNAFARNDITREKYQRFMSSSKTKVNARVLYPHNVVESIYRNSTPSETERLTYQKYWDNLPDYFNGAEDSAICVVDVSGSMYGKPLCAAIGLGAYIAERCKGPFKDYFITFSKTPELVKFTGEDIWAKCRNAMNADWGYNTNIEAVFDLLLQTALSNNVKAEDIPKKLYIFSDMEFDQGVGVSRVKKEVLFKAIRAEWSTHGLTMPEIIFWNLDARQDNIPDRGEFYTYISGFSPVMVEQVLAGKSNIELMLDKLLSPRYEKIFLFTSF